MVSPKQNGVSHYTHASATRLSLATQETALSLPDDELEEEEYTQVTLPVNEPTLDWRRNPNADQVRFGKLYMHEKVSPAEFISSLLKGIAQQGNWFHEFNNLPEGAHYEPYEHDGGNWSNRLIRSTGQRAMASLLHYEGYANQVDLIYMDPPYNINFRSNFQGLINNTSTGNRWRDIPQDVRQVKAFRDSYKEGVHSYLDQLRVQLIHGRDLLKESGSFIMQISPDNLHYVAVLMAEVFGHDNHVATIPYRTTMSPGARLIPEIGNWLIWFAKDKKRVKYNQLYGPASDREDTLELWTDPRLELPDGEVRTLTREEKENPDLIPTEGKLFTTYPCHSASNSDTGRSDTLFTHPDGTPCEGNEEEWNNHKCTPSCDGKNQRNCPIGRQCGPTCQAVGYPCPNNSHWRVSLRGLHTMLLEGTLQIGPQGGIRWKHYEDQVPGRKLNAMWGSAGVVARRRYVVETPERVIERCILMTTEPGDLVLDPTCGSGTTPLQAEKWGRRWIAIDSGATAIALARENIATAVHPYHLLIDSTEGHQKEHQMMQEHLPAHLKTPFEPKGKYTHDPVHGFVLERQRNVSAKTLAYGYDEEEGLIYHHDRTEVSKSAHRVSSGFTVESDMPFTSIQPTETEDKEGRTVFERTETFLNMEEALRTSGIHVPGTNPDPGTNFKVTDLEPTVEIPDVTHTGHITGPDGVAQDAVFYLCQEDETAGSFQTRNLAVAARNRKAAYACIAAFGHEGEASSIERHQGNVHILRAMAKRDLMIPGLEHKEDDQAFVLISEPDLLVHEENGGKINLEVQGLTVYNPVTGQVEPTGDRNIAAILTDTDYDQESFRVRLINLPITEERFLSEIRDVFKKEIDDSKWQRMKSTRTLPFISPGEGGKIAVKVVDYTGMEHMKVIDAP